MCSDFSLVSERVSKQGAALEVFRLTTVFGRDRQAVVEAYDVRRQIETSTNLQQVGRLNQLKTSLYDFLKAAHSIVKDTSANKGVKLDLSDEIEALSEVLLAEFPLMKKPIAEFEAKNYLWHLRHS